MRAGESYQFLVANPINRHLINSPMLPNLKKDVDSGLTIFLQSTSPSAHLEADWLPVPDAWWRS